MRAQLAGVLVSLVLLVSPAGTPSAAAEPPLRLGVTASDAFAEGYYAQEMGFFKKAGLNVEITRFTTGAAIATGVSSGAIDVGVSNVAFLARQIEHGAPLVFIAGGGLYSSRAPISALCIAKNAHIATAKDLEGKTLAITAIGDQTQIGVSAWLEKNNADPSKVRLIQIPFADMGAAIQSGLADAAMMTEPWLSAALHNGSARILAKPYDAVAPEFLIGVWFTSTSWYAKNMTTAKRFASVIYETARWANAHHDQTAPMLATFARLDVQTIRAATRAPYSTSLAPALIQPQLDWAYKIRAIDGPLNANDIIAK
ncbi:MAG TPA: ABC transporter substrate-binding protein [Candidatus Binatia bacterium]|nr:ABC transporter substrate-binding protein [Candidatus Binatia bacterium]